MQQPDVPTDTDYFYCQTCNLAIRKKRQAFHLRKCNGESIQEPQPQPIKKSPPTSDKIFCNICEKSMSLDQFKYHEYICTEPMAPCEYCKRQIYLFRWQSHKNNCSTYLESQREHQQQLIQILKKYFLVIYGVELDSQMSTDTFRLLLNQVLPALDNMNKGMKSKEIQMIQTKEFQREELEMCTICLDSIFKGEAIKEFQCKHILHDECARKALQYSSNCPNCRFNIKSKK